MVDALGGELMAPPIQWAIGCVCGCGAVTHAYRQGHLEVVTLLMKHGADAHLMDKQGTYPFH